MSKFLYGAAVQGIQGFILQTNRLREIVGASEMVAQICTARFAELIGIKETGKMLAEAMREDENFILHAAGNIKYIFHDRGECEKVVREFPKRVMTYAPGISISQAVVEFENGTVNSFQEAIDQLEQKLHVQRNRQMRSLTTGLMGIRRSRQTGLPVVRMTAENGEKDYQDEATCRKREEANTLDLCRRAFGEDVKAEQVAFEMEDLTNQSNNWIAVIHADGNGLGRIVQKVGHDALRFKKFSEDLDTATLNAAQDAYAAVKGRCRKDKIPIRPIVLSGDDFTAICRADLALDYTRAYIEAFEKHTAGIFESGEVFTTGTVRDRMTACAGIAFVKASYPYYYAYDLAEELCVAAKKDAKDKDSIRSGAELPQSCIFFHKVQDSFNQSYGDITERELSPTEGVSLRFGPYYLSQKEGRWTVSDLQVATDGFRSEEGNAVKSTVRRWLTVLHEEPEMAGQMLQRARMLYAGAARQLLLKATTPVNGRVPAYDMLAINTINNQVSK